MYQELNPEAVSVLLADFPKPAISKDSKIIEQVAFIQQVTSLSHKLRATQDIKVRQPLSTLFIKSGNTESIKLFQDYLKEELNIKKIELVKDDSKFTVPYLVVNFKEAGKTLGKGAQELKSKIEGKDFAEQTKIAKKYPENLFEKKLKPRDGFIAETEGDLTVVLDTTLTPELIEEGILRDLIRQIQVARQDAKLEITQRIKLVLVTGDIELTTTINNFQQKIKDEVLASEISVATSAGGAIANNQLVVEV